jgi:hypothetical protein
MLGFNDARMCFDFKDVSEQEALAVLKEILNHLEKGAPLVNSKFVQNWGKHFKLTEDQLFVSLHNYCLSNMAGFISQMIAEVEMDKMEDSAQEIITSIQKAQGYEQARTFTDQAK